jgi:hypothetical protein
VEAGAGGNLDAVGSRLEHRAERLRPLDVAEQRAGLGRAGHRRKPVHVAWYGGEAVDRDAVPGEPGASSSGASSSSSSIGTTSGESLTMRGPPATS